MRTSMQGWIPFPEYRGMVLRYNEKMSNPQSRHISSETLFTQTIRIDFAHATDLMTGLATSAQFLQTVNIQQI